LFFFGYLKSPLVSEHNRLWRRETLRLSGQIGDQPPDLPIEAGLQLGCDQFIVPVVGENRVAIELAESTMHESVEIDGTSPHTQQRSAS